MAYFSNGTEGMAFDEECGECILFNKACPIALVQSLYNYEAVNNKTASEILNCLVHQNEDGSYEGCRMKKILEQELK